MDNTIRNEMEEHQQWQPADFAACNAAPRLKSRREFLLMSAALLATIEAAAANHAANLSFVCSPENDLFRALRTKARVECELWNRGGASDSTFSQGKLNSLLRKITSRCRTITTGIPPKSPQEAALTAASAAK